MNDEPMPLADALGAVTRDLGLGRPTHLRLLVAQWDTIVGDALATHARPSQLRDNVLVVEVDDGAWAAPLRYLVDTMCVRANEVLGSALVQEVRVVVRREESRGRGAHLG